MKKEDLFKNKLFIYFILNYDVIEYYFMNLQKNI
jgi:hypothetical protein